MGMLHGVAHTIGKVLRPVHAGDDKLASRRLQRHHAATIRVASPAFSDGAPIPRRHAQEGENLSPALELGELPAGTHEIVILCEDPDAPFAHPFLHWLAHGIDPRARSLPEGVPHGMETALLRQSKNGAKKVGYDGPAPPPGHGVHRYHFQVFALARTIEVSPLPTREEVLDAMRGHVLGYGDLVGTYERT